MGRATGRRPAQHQRCDPLDTRRQPGPRLALASLETNAQLADAVGPSPSPCLLRVKRLQHAGLITGFNARLDLAKLGETNRRENFVRFERTLQNFDEVMECHLISGGYNYLVEMVVPSVAGFQSIMEWLLESDAGISKYFSYVADQQARVPGPHAVRGSRLSHHPRVWLISASTLG